MPKSLNIKNQNKEKSTWKAMDRAALFSSAPSVSWGPSPPNNTNNNDKKRKRQCLCSTQTYLPSKNIQNDRLDLRYRLSETHYCFLTSALWTYWTGSLIVVVDSSVYCRVWSNLLVASSTPLPGMTTQTVPDIAKWPVRGKIIPVGEPLIYRK